MDTEDLFGGAKEGSEIVGESDTVVPNTSVPESIVATPGTPAAAPKPTRAARRFLKLNASDFRRTAPHNAVAKPFREIRKAWLVKDGETEKIVATETKPVQQIIWPAMYGYGPVSIEFYAKLEAPAVDMPDLLGKIEALIKEEKLTAKDFYDEVPQITMYYRLVSDAYNGKFVGVPAKTFIDSYKALVKRVDRLFRFGFLDLIMGAV